MNQQKNILILGSLSGNSKGKVDLYNVLIDACKTSLPTFTITSPIGPQVMPKDDYEKRKICFEKIKKASLIIGDQTLESSAQGIEMREAEIQNKPFIITAETGSRISGIVSSSPSLIMTIFYDNREEVKTKLMAALKALEF